LLAAAPEWRWGMSGEATPWYGSMRLVRQSTAGDWGRVVDRLQVDLEERIRMPPLPPRTPGRSPWRGA